MTIETERRNFIRGVGAAAASHGAAATKYVDIYMEAIKWDNAARLYEQYSREG